MKKSIFLFSFLFFITNLWSQETEKKLTMNPFIGLKVYSNIEVNLISSDVNKAIICGENSDFVVLSSKNKILKIRVSGGRILTTGPTKIDLYHSEPIEFLGAYQGSLISSSFPIRQTSLKLESKSNAIIKLEVYCDRLDTKATYGGKVFLKGKTISHELLFASSGICESDKLISEQSKIKSIGGAYAYLFVNSLVDTKLYGGTLRIQGNTKKRIIQKALGAKVVFEE